MDKKILIIDDEPATIKLTQIMLEANHYDVAHALDGNEGLAKARQWKPDIILLDLKMSMMDGYEVCHRLRGEALTKKIPILVYTALHEWKSIKRALKTGANDCLVKPFDIEVLLWTIKSMLSGRRYKFRQKKKATAKT
jgi:DNA-binding response OmpR family regulator